MEASTVQNCSEHPSHPSDRMHSCEQYGAPLSPTWHCVLQYDTESHSLHRIILTPVLPQHLNIANTCS